MLARRVLLMVACIAGPVLAQETRPDTVNRVEQALARVRRLTTADVAGARALADSLVKALPDAEPAQAEALFARASIAASAAEAEADYERLARFHPLSPRVPDALMRLAVLESSRNDRAGALRHLDRLLREHGDAPPTARASLLAGRLRMEAGDVARACDHLGAAYAAATATERDVQEQATRLGARCPVAPATLAANRATPMGVVRGQRDTVLRVTTVPPAQRLTRAQRDSIATASRDSATRAASTRRDSVARAAAVRRDSAASAARAAETPATAARFAVQFAAYNTRSGAEGLVTTLRARGIPARVEGEVAPFRVRAGRYASRTEAEIAAQGWRTGGQAAIVVPASPEARP